MKSCQGTCQHRQLGRVRYCPQWSIARARRLTCRCRWATRCAGSGSQTLEDLRWSGSGGHGVAPVVNICTVLSNIQHLTICCVTFYRQYSFTGLKMRHIYIPPVLGRALLPKYPRDLSQCALLRMTTFQSSCVLNLIKNFLLFYVLYMRFGTFGIYGLFQPKMVPVAVLHRFQDFWHCAIGHLLCWGAWSGS